MSSTASKTTCKVRPTCFVSILDQGVLILVFCYKFEFLKGDSKWISDKLWFVICSKCAQFAVLRDIYMVLNWFCFCPELAFRWLTSIMERFHRNFTNPSGSLKMLSLLSSMQWSRQIKTSAVKPYDSIYFDRRVRLIH